MLRYHTGVPWSWSPIEPEGARAKCSSTENLLVRDPPFPLGRVQLVLHRERAVEPVLDVVALQDDATGVPLPHRIHKSRLGGL